MKSFGWLTVSLFRAKPPVIFVSSGAPPVIVTGPEDVGSAFLAKAIQAATMFCAFLLASVGSMLAEQRPQKAFRNLEEAIKAGVVDRDVTKSLTGIVVLKDHGEIAVASATPAAPSPLQPDAVFQETRPAVLKAMYDAQKARILGFPPRFETLRRYELMPVALVKFGSKKDLLATINDPEVAAVALDHRSHIQFMQSLPLIKQPVVASWGGEMGSGVTIASIDTGLNYLQTPAITAFFGGCTTPGSPGCRVVAEEEIAAIDNSLDDVGHGTAVAMIAGSTAPGATIASLDVSDSGGTISDSAAIAAFDWAMLNRTRYNIRVANLSFGSGASTGFCDGDILIELSRPLANLRNAGIAPVVASGNSATPGGRGFADGIASPACLMSAIAVGAIYDANIGTAGSAPPDTCTDTTTMAGQIPCWSQTAPILTLLAPGDTISTLNGSWAGTSMSAPFVSGAAAVLFASNPNRSVSDIQNALETTGPLTPDSRNGSTQHLLDIAAAQCVFNGLTNDNFASAQIISGFGSLLFRNWCATHESGEPNHAGVLGNRSSWFRWTAPFNGDVVFSTAGSNHDTILAVYQGTALTALTRVASNDDQLPLTTSEVRFTVTAGQLFAIAVDAKASVTTAGAGGGTVKLTWRNADANDSFSTPVQLNAEIYHEVDGVNIGATKQPNEPNHCSDPGGASVWYSWTSFVSGKAIAQVTQSVRKCVAVYIGTSVGALTAIGTYPYRDGDDTVWFDAAPNTTYYIAVDGLLSEDSFPRPNESTFRLRVGLRKQIAFTSLRDGNYEIYLMEPDGSSQRRLTNHPASDREPASDTFDASIAFTSNRDGNNEIYLMNSDGTNVRRITNNPANDHSPVFTSDGGAILFVSDRDGNPELYLVGLGGFWGTNTTRLTTSPDDDLDPAIVMLPSRISTIAHSAFRVLDPQTGVGDYDLVVQLESGQEIWTGTSAEDREPSWSRDGQNLVFTTIDTQGFETLWAWDLTQRAHSLGFAQGSHASWSPWQDEIVFATTRTGQGQIFKMKADGSGATNLSNSAAWDGEPRW